MIDKIEQILAFFPRGIVLSNHPSFEGMGLGEFRISSWAKKDENDEMPTES